MPPKITATARLNGFAKAHEFVCRRTEAGTRHLAIVRTGIEQQPYRVTSSPEPTDDIVLSVAE